MRQFFVEEKPAVGSRVRLAPEDERHLLRVLRAEEEEPIQVAHGGELFRGRLKIEDGGAFVSIEEKVEVERTEGRLVLAQGVGKNQKTETVLKHGTECGIDAFIPVQTDRSVSNLAKKYSTKRTRFEKIAEEAAKQSNRSRVPTIGDLLTVDGLIDAVGEDSDLIVCYEGDVKRDILDLDLAADRDAYVLVGAEGGLSEREVARLEKSGAIFVTMGPNILRTETAGIVASYVLSRLMERGKR
ncbi:MAG: RsmE family RNA methyltransferase [Peptoniphilus sp.]|nr:RsmE family RNA methyltransferase [Peptoniphilus sp.]MDD7362752.1 RsmE family RNA methyltransferase [Bacillota bacterium]MDY6044554.1 RsmE family RNA methyltransferase [Peptoniphilus sp.]